MADENQVNQPISKEPLGSWTKKKRGENVPPTPKENKKNNILRLLDDSNSFTSILLSDSRSTSFEHDKALTSVKHELTRSIHFDIINDGSRFPCYILSIPPLLKDKELKEQDRPQMDLKILLCFSFSFLFQKKTTNKQTNKRSNTVLRLVVLVERN